MYGTKNIYIYSQNPVSKHWLYVPREWASVFLNSPHKQSVWYLSLSCSTATNSCSFPLPFLENLAPKQRKAKTENRWSRLAKAGCQEKGVFQKILHPQVSMLNYSDHNIPLVLVQFYFFVLPFCVSFSICYWK